MNDPLWAETEGIEAFGRDDLLELAQAGVTEYLAARPTQAETVAPLLEQIEKLTQ
jgi:hypothetical protein